MKHGCLLPVAAALLVVVAWVYEGWGAWRVQRVLEERERIIVQLRAALAEVSAAHKDCRSKLTKLVAESANERCRDGRTCTDAVEPLPHLAIEPAPRLEQLAPQCKGYGPTPSGKPDDELATCYHVAASMLRVRARAFTDPEVVRKTLFKANILDAEVFRILGTVPGDGQ